MKKIFVLLLGLVALFGTVKADSEIGCDRHYQSAVKFIVDTPAVHPFSINSRGATVIFSSGNLQYCPARNEWRFALRQFDRVGNGKSVYAPDGLQSSNTDVNGNITTVFYDSIDYTTKDNTTASGFKEIKGVPCSNLMVSKNYNGWVDLFAWGTSGRGRAAKDENTAFFYPYELSNTDLENTNNKYGYGPSYGGGRGEGARGNDIDTTSGTNRLFDWGYRNAIREYYDCVYDDNNRLVSYSDEDATMYRAGIWRTLTVDEWEYILTKRVVDGQDSAFSYVRLQYGANASDTVTGVLIYPDDFSFANAGVAILPFGANYPVSDIDRGTWEALEEAGCVFLPGSRRYDLTDNMPSIDEGSYGNKFAYWSSTAYNAGEAYCANFYLQGYEVQPTKNNSRYFGLSVRLAQDYTLQDPSPAAFSISATQKVEFSSGNLQYRANPEAWRFAPQQYHRCGANNANVSSTYNNWIDLFGWGTSGVTSGSTTARPPYYTTKTNTNYSWSDWGGNKIERYAINTWRTLDKGEWDHLFNTRKVNGAEGYSCVRLKNIGAYEDTVTGIIIYPDAFTWENAGVDAIPVGNSAFTEVDKQVWDALEKVGCVFLPGCANREENKITAGNYGVYINYWTSSASGNDKAFRLDCNIMNNSSRHVDFERASDRYMGYPVRLVRNL